MLPYKKVFLLCGLILCFAFFSKAQSYGCTDSQAQNFDPIADVDNGSCCYENWFTVDAGENVYYVEFSSLNSLNGILVPFEYYGFCGSLGCYSMVVYAYDSQQPAPVTILVNGSVVFQEDIMISEVTLTGQAGFTLGLQTSGCTSSFACNYNPSATCDDGSCIFGCAGCTDPNSPNYNAEATIDDGTCCTNENYISVTVTGTDPSIFVSNLYSIDGFWLDQVVGNSTRCYDDGCYTIKVDSSANTDNYYVTVTNHFGEILTSGDRVALQTGISFSINETPGCMDVVACNFNPQATCGDFSLCDYTCLGCTDPSAGNFNSEATNDDGSCCYNYYTIIADGPIQWNLWNNSGSESTYGVYPTNANFCLQPGCFQIQLNNYTGGPAINWSILDNDGNVAFTGLLGPLAEFIPISYNSISGCIDPSACNFAPEANCSDYTLCNYDCFGCTDPTAPNYNPTATVDNGTCCTDNWFTVVASEPGTWYAYSYSNFWWQGGHYPETPGFCFADGCFTFSFQPDVPNAQNYSVQVFNIDNEVVASGAWDVMFFDITLTIDNGGVSGCTDASACNFNPLATCIEGAFCDYSCYGCTDPTAPNYDPQSTIDDGSCCTGEWFTIEFNGEAYWTISSSNGGYQFGEYPLQNGFCFSDDCFHLSAWSMAGTDLNYSIVDNNGQVVDSGVIDAFGSGTLVSMAESISGCGEPSACNYNPAVNCNDYFSCDYSCYGCTDPQAPNFDPTATIDDFSCCNASWYTVIFDSPAYWYTNSPDVYGAGGLYPDVNGFCYSGDCFSITVYSMSAEPNGFSVIDESGNEIFTGIAYPNSYFPFSISNSIDEVAGCTEPSACNYNPEATCFDGSCNYYCGGCMDQSALNYNQNALFEDGTCFYQIEPPVVGMTMLPDEDNNQYYVMTTMMVEGNGLPYVLSSNYDSQFIMLNESGQYVSGPYPCDSQIEFTLQSLSVGLSTYLTTEMEGACTISTSSEEINTNSNLSLYPNPSNGQFTIGGIAASRARISISDMSGRIMMEKQLNVSAGMMEINIDSFSPGVYQVSVITESTTQTTRLLLNK